MVNRLTTQQQTKEDENYLLKYQYIKDNSQEQLKQFLSTH